MSVPAVLRLIRSAVSLALLAPLLATAVPVLIVDAVSGEVSSERLGVARQLVPGDVVAERDVLRTVGDARLSLRFGGEGLLELGPDAALAIEKLPADAEAADLRSLLSLWSGYLRVLWVLPAQRPSWPFYLYFGGQRSALVPGEYFFERRGEAIRSCVASGRLTVTAIAGNGVEQLRAGACYDLQVADTARRQVRNAENWDAVRREYTTRPTGKPPAVEPPVVPAASAPVPTTPPPGPPAVPVVVVPAASGSPRPAVSAQKPATAAVSPAASPVTRPRSLPPVPAVATAAPAGGPGGWALMVGSFSDPANASQVESRLKAGGYLPFTRVRDINGRTWHSVQVRGYPSREVAETKAADVRSRLGYKNVMVVLLP